MHGLVRFPKNPVSSSTGLGREEMRKEEDPQKIAAAAYDYESDPRWAEYWSNILIPPHMASRPNVIDHFKLKFYQRYIDPDIVVEAMASNGTSQPSRPSASSSSSPPQSDQAQPRNSGSSTRTSRVSAGAGHSPTSLHWDRQTIQFSVNAWVFVVATLAVLPIVPRNLSNRAYRLSFMGTAGSSLYSLYTIYGKPQAWNLQAVQAWFQLIVVAKDFIYFIYSMTFISSHLSLKFSLIPILCRAVVHVAKFLRRNFSRSSLYRWQSNIVPAFMYWQLLKLMYHAPVTANYHRVVWAKGRTLEPHILRYAPFLSTPILAVQRWWFR